MTAPSGQDTFARSSAEIGAVHLARDSRQSDGPLWGSLHHSGFSSTTPTASRHSPERWGGEVIAWTDDEKKPFQRGTETWVTPSV